MTDDLGRRVRDLRALAGEHMPVVHEAFGGLICDRCGYVEPLTEQEVNAGVPGERFNAWGRGPEGDVCPTCAAADDPGAGRDIE